MKGVPGSYQAQGMAARNTSGPGRSLIVASNAYLHGGATESISWGGPQLAGRLVSLRGRVLEAVALQRGHQGGSSRQSLTL